MGAAVHTPSEWVIKGPSSSVADSPEGGDYAIVADGQIIAEVFFRSSPTHTHDAHAHARLIAAAPGMAALLPKLREIVAEEADDTLSLFEGDPEQAEMVEPYDALLREIDAVMAKIAGGTQ